jgi:hypothetical protein
MIKLSTKTSSLLAGLLRKFTCLLFVGLGLLLGHPAPAAAATPDGTIELSGGKIAAGVGYSWGSGTLIFKGKRYRLNVSGISVGSVGVNEYTGSGTVSGLGTARDINGIYTAAAGGLTLGNGAGVTEMRNKNGVTIQLDSNTEGLGVTLAAKGVQISLAE